MDENTHRSYTSFRKKVTTGCVNRRQQSSRLSIRCKVKEVTITAWCTVVAGKGVAKHADETS